MEDKKDRLKRMHKLLVDQYDQSGWYLLGQGKEQGPYLVLRIAPRYYLHLSLDDEGNYELRVMRTQNGGNGDVFDRQLILGKSLYNLVSVQMLVTAFQAQHDDADSIEASMGIFGKDYPEVKPEPEPEPELGTVYRLGYGGNHDEDSEATIEINPGCVDHDLVAVRLEDTSKMYLAGMDLKKDHIDLGVWNSDDEWIVLATVNAQTGLITHFANKSALLKQYRGDLFAGYPKGQGPVMSAD